MPRLKLTTRAVEKLCAPDPSGRPVLYWDAEMRGLGVLCSGSTNSKSYVVQRDLPGGKTRRVTIAATNVISLDTARRRAAEVLAEMYKGVDPKKALKAAAAASTTLRDAFRDYLTGVVLRDNTVRDYRTSVEKHLAPWLDRSLRSITPEDVEQRHREIAREVAAQGRYSGEATANGAMRAFRAIWNFAAERDPELPSNPTGRLRRSWFPVPRREGFVRSEDLPRFYEAVIGLASPVARDYLLLLLFTGLRRQEAASLRWDDIDFGARIIRLPAERTKARRRLDLPMTDIVFDLLLARRPIGGEFVFPSNSRSGHIAEPKFPLTQVAVASGIQVSAHDLRRTFITVAESTDISPLALKALVNHSLGGDVTSGYIQMSPERLREPAQRVVDRLKELCGICEPGGMNVARLHG